MHGSEAAEGGVTLLPTVTSGGGGSGAFCASCPHLLVGPGSDPPARPTPLNLAFGADAYHSAVVIQTRFVKSLQTGA
jgi:hypothetical protein